MCLYLVTLLETMGITAIDRPSSTMGRLPAIVSPILALENDCLFSWRSWLQMDSVEAEKKYAAWLFFYVTQKSGFLNFVSNECLSLFATRLLQLASVA